MARKLTLGAKLLARRCKEFGERARIARELGVCASTITRWCDGYSVPLGERRADVERITGVHVGAWEVLS